MTPKVSIIMPCYNYDRYIDEAILSVLAQTEQDWELIVVDDGSTDNSLATAQQHQDQRIRVLSQSNQGVSAARNNGLRHSVGRYVAFLDADDRLRPGRLAAALAVFEKAPAVDIVASDFVRFVNETGEILPSQFELVPAWKHLAVAAVEGTEGLLISGNHIAALAGLPMPIIWIHGVVARGDLARAVAFPEGVRICEDSWYFYRLMQTCSQVVLLNRVLAEVRRHGKNSFNDPAESLLPELAMFQGLWHDAPSGTLAGIYRKAMGRVILKLGYYRRTSGARREALRYYAEALQIPGVRLNAMRGMIATVIP
jgi:glycosyltransferase involved in cell wall biosynthesis